MILVTGATGNVGSEVVRSIQDRAVVRAAVRDVERARQTLGADIDFVRLDFQDASTFPEAFADVTRLFLVRPPHIANASVFAPVLEAAQAAGVEQVVFLSVQGVERVSFIPHAKIEKLVAASGLPYVFLRAGFFMQNLSTTHRADIRDHRQIMLPAGKSQTAFIDVRDIGTVAARLMETPHQQDQALTLTGAEALNYDQVAEIFTAELGFPITYPNPSVPRFAWHMWRHGHSPATVAVMSFLYTTTRLGQAAQVHGATAEVLGRPPRSLAEFVHDFRDCWLPQS